MIFRVKTQDIMTAARLAAELWPSHSADELSAGFESLIAGSGSALFLCCDRDTPIGFAQCQLRHDYVEGTSTSPVGYLEGIFVREGYRMRGYAKALLSACEQWAKEQGCREFASDCELNNSQSLAFHLRSAFSEANRIICFTKQL